jgi:hypothetical protein
LPARENTINIAIFIVYSHMNKPCNNAMDTKMRFLGGFSFFVCLSLEVKNQFGPEYVSEDS